MCKVQGKVQGCGGSRLGSVGSGGSCARRSRRDGGWWVGSSKRRLAAKAVIAACVRKAVHLDRSVPSFGPGEAGDERGGFLTPAASHFDA